MKTIPMIFNTEMVKALLDGRKTVTRRPMKPQPEDSGLGYKWIPSNIHQSMIQVSGIDDVDCDHKKEYLKDLINKACRYGNIGDLIWVRETSHCVMTKNESGWLQTKKRTFTADGDKKPDERIDDFHFWKTIPSIHMPRWASRLTLRVTDVRIERVQDITEEEAKKEGVAPAFIDQFGNCPTSPRYKNGFYKIWNSIYSNLNENPYVWVIEFEVIHKNVDEMD